VAKGQNGTWQWLFFVLATTKLFPLSLSLSLCLFLSPPFFVVIHHFHILNNVFIFESVWYAAHVALAFPGISVPRQGGNYIKYITHTPRTACYKFVYTNGKQTEMHLQFIYLQE